MLDSVVHFLELYEPTISSIVGLLTLGAAVWGVLRLTARSREREDAGSQGKDAVATQASAAPAVSWQGLFDLGLTEHSRLEELVSVRTVNVALFCLLLLSFPWFLICLVTSNSAALTLANLAAFTSALLGFALQRAGAVAAARWLVIGSVAAYWLVAMVAVGPNQGTEYFIAVVMAMPVLILSRAQTVQRVLCIVFIVTVFVVGVGVTRDRTPPPSLDPAILAIGYHANALFLAAMIFACVSYYKRFASSSYQMLSSRKERHDALVSKFIPPDIAKQIVNREAVAAKWHPEATILVATLTGFADLYSRLPAIDLVEKLDTLYSRFDQLIDGNGLEKVKTLGTTYVAAAGLADGASGYAAVAASALAMRDIVREFAREHDLPIGFRCGVATGLTISGVIGKSRPRFDLWGEALDAAAALEGKAGADEILVNDTAYWRMRQDFSFAAEQQDSLVYTLLAEQRGNELAS